MPKEEKEKDEVTIGFRLDDPQTISNLQDRVGTTFAQSIHTVARRDLERYYKAIPYTLYCINLRYGEAMALIDILNGYLMQPEIPHMLVPNIEYGIRYEGIAEKWDIDGDAFLAKLKRLSPIECLVLNDAVERWWGEQYHVEGETQEERCIRVGLIRGSEPPRRTAIRKEGV